MKKSILLTATILGSLFVSAQAVAGASGNIGVTSNYIWRGVSQTGDGPAVSGGLDYEAENGLYVGTWASNVDFGGTTDTAKGTELDVYAGYSKELANGFGVDGSVTHYAYPGDTLSGDFTEVALSGSYKAVEAGIAYTVDSENDTGAFIEGDMYSHIGVSKELANGVGLGATIGHYNFDDETVEDYNHLQLSVSKDDFTFAIDDTDMDGSDPLYSVSWTKSFDF